MAKALEPPDILAELCTAFHRWEERGWLAQHIPQAEAVLGSEAISSAMDETELVATWSRLAPGLKRLPERAAPPVDLFFEALKLLHALDFWHEPLSAPYQSMTATHDLVRTRFKVPVSDVYSYNSNVEFGMIIPPWTQAEARPSSEMSNLARLLDHTAYLPAEVLAGDPDQPRKVGDRRLQLRYRRGPSGLPLPPGDDPPIIALAPVLEKAGDASIALNASDKVYGVDLHYDWARIGEILDAALESGARILLLPEMTIRYVDAPRLMKLFKQKLRERLAKGGEPSLLYLIAGLVAGRDEGAAAGLNDVALFHAFQDETAGPFLRQSKLCRWNLDKGTQEDFLHRSHCSLLKEDIVEGREIYVTDLEGLGRTLTLICADMEANEPGHWLIKNIGVDWLYAPIMDRSISHRVQTNKAGSPQLKPWVLDRAAVAVRQGAMRAVVVNSLALTFANNASPAKRPYLPFTKCGWAFMLDGSEEQRTYRELDSGLPIAAGARPVVCAVRWLDGFKPAPPAMS